jgi:hypothetical protein
LESGGAPIESCANFFNCDPDTYYIPQIQVPTDAKYIPLQGSCAAMVGMYVEPFVLGQLPSTPQKEEGTAASTSGATGDDAQWGSASATTTSSSAPITILFWKQGSFGTAILRMVVTAFTGALLKIHCSLITNFLEFLKLNIEPALSYLPGASSWAHREGQEMMMH